MKKLLFILLLLPNLSFADDWGGGFGKITRIYFYGDTVLFDHSAPSYADSAQCKNHQRVSFKLSEIGSDEMQNRLYSFLLTAYTAQLVFKPLFHNTECGPENFKKFTGRYVLGN